MLFAGNAHPTLAQRVAEYLQLPLGKIEVGRFPDGEVSVEFQQNIRNGHVVIIQPTCAPAENLLELIFMADVARGSAARVSAVIPYFGYQRQDRKDRPRVGISARTVADMLMGVGIKDFVFLDLHAPQIQGFFQGAKADHLYSRPVFCNYLRQRDLGTVKIGPPDIGRAAMAESYAKRLRVGVFSAVKVKHDGDPVVQIIGKVGGSDTLILDDVIATGKTMVAAALELKRCGAASIDAVASTGQFVERDAKGAPCLERMVASPIRTFYVGDTVPIPQRAVDLLGDRLVQITFAPLLGETIRRIHEGGSVSELFEEEPVAALYPGSYTIP